MATNAALPLPLPADDLVHAVGRQWPDGFAREFATADGARVMVAAHTRQQFADLARATRLVRTFAFLERVLHADFSAADDLQTHQDSIAALLVPWFARRSVADLTATLAGTSVPWARLHNLEPSSRRHGHAAVYRRN